MISVYMFSLTLLPSKIDASNPQNHYQSTCVIRPAHVAYSTVECGVLPRVATGISGVAQVTRVSGGAVERRNGATIQPVITAAAWTVVSTAVFA